ncbi:dual specificity protein phosphatase DSP8 [Pyrus ussuriensis x Pyrus communis]|uniref:phosphatidylglycerophosphatase n=1 Tax=Pyrus ussuriensis x Pyrus communis TaxID=2448454 RepID=A0A5N5GUX3_9ROSA|nr:phosphatidylglycerophosphate phosphatase PTPMT2 [Pyrus x bretschneideri]KAB2618433.1 dual specificity protein phosphatase DSP8 [Pyrus ussuriensis x Pyrus communis]
MKIEELEAEGDCDRNDGLSGRQIVGVDDAKRALVGAGARILFYPTLLYNVLRNKMEAEFRWWDEVDQFVLLGAVPFPKDVPQLKRLGVGGVITLNEPYETLVPTSLYRAHGIDHLVIPTRDYLFAPSFVDIDRAVEFIHENASCGEVTYVHCKAGRGRSTTIVLCYLVKYKNMTPSAALDYVRSRRPRVLLAPSQWKAVLEYSRCGSTTAACSPSGDAVLITKDDLEGYHGTYDDTARKQLAIVPKMVKASPMIARLSCLFASLKVSGNCGPVARRLSVPEPRAC